MSAEDLEKYETEMELSLYREYKDIVGQFSYVIETERRFYLANDVKLTVGGDSARPVIEVELTSAERVALGKSADAVREPMAKLS